MATTKKFHKCVVFDVIYEITAGNMDLGNQLLYISWNST